MRADPRLTSFHSSVPGACELLIASGLLIAVFLDVTSSKRGFTAAPLAELTFGVAVPSTVQDFHAVHASPHSEPKRGALKN